MQRIARMVNQRPGIYWTCLALFAYGLTALVMMYPGFLHLDSVIIGEERGDAYRYVWTLWWAKQAALRTDMDLAHLILLNHPVGVELPFMLTGIAVNLQALPFALLLPPATVYNLQILLSFILSGLTMYLFCVELTGDRKAGLVGGFVFGFFVNKTGHVLAGHLPQVTVHWVPLYALFLWRTVRRPSWRSALLAGLALAPACLIHVMHLAYLVLPVTVAVLLIGLVGMGRGFFTRRRLGLVALVFGLAAVLAGPFLIPTVLHFAEGAGYLYRTGIVKSSTDVLAFLTPSPYHPVLDALGLLPSFAGQVFPSQESLREGLAYPGVLGAGLALWGLVRKRQRAWVWGVLALAAAVLSLGPLLKVGGELVLYKVEMQESRVVLPYALLKQAPLLDVGRTPGRLNEATMFAVAVLASYGVAASPSLIVGRPRLSTLLLALTLIGMGFEYVAIWPFPVSTAEIPPTIQDIARESSDGALLHLGMTRREVHHRALYYQTATQRPCVGGSVHRTRPEVPPWWETLSGLAQADQGSGDVVPRPDLAERRGWLRHFDVDYILVHRNTEEWNNPSYRDYLETLLGSPEHQDGSLAAFQVPGEVPAPGSGQLYTFSREGWLPPERDGDLWRRWMYDDGRIYLYSRREEVGSLRFTVDSHLEFPVLEVYLGERLLDSLIVGERVAYTTAPFTLTQGINVLRFRAPSGCHEVVDDPRCWSEALLVPPGGAPAIPCEPTAVRTTCRTFVFDSVSFVPQEKLLPGEFLDVNFGDRMRLRAWGLDRTAAYPGEALTVTLTWEAMVELSDQYVVFVHLLSPDGRLVAQHDAPPVGRVLPSSAWLPGTVFTYPVRVDLPDGLPAGEYHLQVGVYLWPGLERLPVLADVPGASRRVMELRDVRIVP